MTDDIESTKFKLLMNYVKKFNSMKTENIYGYWTQWIEKFKHFADAVDIENPKKKKAWMLLIGGEDLQNIENQQLKQQNPNGNVDQSTDVYAECEKRLDKYFTGLHFIEKFMQIRQGAEETFDQFLARLRETSTKFKFLHPMEENKIKKQIGIGAKNSEVRKKARELADLDQIIKFARESEIVENSENPSHVAVDDVPTSSNEKRETLNSRIRCGRVEKTTTRQKIKKVFKTVHKISNLKHRNSIDLRHKLCDSSCSRCGSNSHFTGAKGCIAWGKFCRHCKGKNHFEECCFKKKKMRSNRNTETTVTSSDNMISGLSIIKIECTE